MNIDKITEQLEAGFKNPETIIRRIMLSDEKMAENNLRRRDKESTQHPVWMITVGEVGQAPAAWWVDHTITKILKKALAWRGVPPRTRKTRKTNGASVQQQA